MLKLLKLLVIGDLVAREFRLCAKLAEACVPEPNRPVMITSLIAFDFFMD